MRDPQITQIRTHILPYVEQGHAPCVCEGHCAEWLPAIGVEGRASRGGLAQGGATANGHQEVEKEGGVGGTTAKQNVGILFAKKTTSLTRNLATLGTSQSVLIRGVASFQGSRIEGVH